MYFCSCYICSSNFFCEFLKEISQKYSLLISATPNDKFMPCVCSPEYKDGHHYVEWIASVFSSCAYTIEDQISFIFGLINIGFWIFAQVFFISLYFQSLFFVIHLKHIMSPFSVSTSLLHSYNFNFVYTVYFPKRCFSCYFPSYTSKLKSVSISSFTYKFFFNAAPFTMYKTL